MAIHQSIYHGGSLSVTINKPVYKKLPQKIEKAKQLFHSRAASKNSLQAASPSKMSSPQPRRSPRLAAKQQNQTPVRACSTQQQPSKEFFRARRSPRLEAKRTAGQHRMIQVYKQAFSHPNYIYIKSLPEVRECANQINWLIDDVSNTSNTVEKIRKVYNVYNFLLTNHVAHKLFTVMPCFRYITLARITDFCNQLPYNTTLPIQRNRLLRLHDDLKYSQYYVPEPY